jgi:MFS family permease
MWNTFHPLQLGNFRKLWLAALISSFGDALNNVALLSLVLMLTGSGFIVALILIARMIPSLILAPIVAKVADNFPRRSVMVIADIVRAIFALGFLFIRSAHFIPLAYVLVVILSSGTAFFQPSRSASVPDLVDKQDLVAANSLLQMATRVIAVIGAGLGGFIVALTSPQFGFIINSISFLASALLLVRIPSWNITSMAAAVHASILSKKSDTISRITLIKSPLLLATICLMAAWALSGGAFGILLSLFPVSVFHVGATGIGSLYAAYGLGIFIGGLIIPAVVSKKSANQLLFVRRLIICIGLGYGIEGIAEVGVAGAPNIYLAITSMAAVGVCIAIGESPLLTIQMSETNENTRGSFFSFVNGIENTILLLSSLLGGVLSVAISPRLIGALAGIEHFMIGMLFIPIALYLAVYEQSKKASTMPVTIEHIEK